MKIFSYIIIGIVAAAVVAGFFVIGSPATERLRRADDQRIADLQNIQWQVVNYWQSKEKLPTNLDMLTDNISGWRAPLDPETGTNYNYQATGELSFNLCANFNLEGSDNSEFAVPRSAPKMIDAPASDNWQHSSGYHCFERTIDPDLYPPITKQ